ncbi:MAG: hypothetical protein ABI647_08070 [Gemmatimonadota bacterium]
MRGRSGRWIWLGLPLVLWSAAPQGNVPRYRFRCAAFAEVVRSTIRSQTGRIVVEDTASREGILVVRRVGTDSIEAWYDSLTVWRAGEGVRETPETDGVIGGRFRGALSPDGRYTAAVRPFVPDELLDVTDVGVALDEFFPRLPPVALEKDREARDTTGWRIRRTGDVSLGRIKVRRYEWKAVRAGNRRHELDDTLGVGMDERSEEAGSIVWHPDEGPLSWTKTITVTAKIPTQGTLKRNVYSRVVQQITVTRRPDYAACKE